VFTSSSAWHQVLVEQGAGSGSGYPDDDYRGAGAEILSGMSRFLIARI
jgi:alanine dehydrogenase